MILSWTILYTHSIKVRENLHTLNENHHFALAGYFKCLGFVKAATRTFQVKEAEVRKSLHHMHVSQHLDFVVRQN